MSVVSGQSNGTVEVTPSGIPVYYQSQPKRLYRVGIDPLTKTDEAYPVSHEHLLASAQGEDWQIAWDEVPSVTTVLGVLDKPALPWWGMKVGIEGVRELCRQGLWLPIMERYQNWYAAETDDIVALLTEHKLTVNHVRDKAGDRGQAVHDALENWARYGHRPDPSIYPEEQEGYVRGLLAFLDDVPSAEPVRTEVLVASAKYGYAGRYDLDLRTHQPHEVVARRTKTKVLRRTLNPGLYRKDLKTSKGVYASHARQLAAYEEASVESGYELTDGQGILLVTPDGHYEVRRSWATFADFECVLRVWQSEEEMKARKRAA